MGDDYLWVWADHGSRVTVLKVRGELDASTAGRFAADAGTELRQEAGLVAVDLSLLDFLDCTGARTLAAVIRAVPRWQLTEVRGIRPPVARLLELIGIDLSVLPGHGNLSARGQELLVRSRETRAQSQEVLLESGAAMARLAATYTWLAATTQRCAEQEDARAARLRTLSDTARDLATRFRECALYVPAGVRPPSRASSPLTSSRC